VRTKHKVLFVLKRHHYGPSYGLSNSCQFVAEALRLEGVEAKVVEVVDNNSIDREVTHFSPTHVIIEALWVVPQKFPVLLRLHPSAQWAVRIHSNPPFISGEGMALEWLRGYHHVAKDFRNFRVAANSRKMATELDLALGFKSIYLPNIYTDSLIQKPITPLEKTEHHGHVNIGCFGAIRPLKNHLEQAFAAIIFAGLIERPLRFHINATRVEQNSDPILRNLISLFAHGPNHLVQHPWMPHDQFISVLRRMDYGLQVSFSETFNIVAADFVYNEIPFVGSKEIEWLTSHSTADPTNWENIVEHLGRSNSPHIIQHNKHALRDFSIQSLKEWLEYIHG